MVGNAQEAFSPMSWWAYLRIDKGSWDGALFLDR